MYLGAITSKKQKKTRFFRSEQVQKQNSRIMVVRVILLIYRPVGAVSHAILGQYVIVIDWHWLPYFTSWISLLDCM